MSFCCTDLYLPDLLQLYWPQEEENWNEPPAMNQRNGQVLLKHKTGSFSEI